MFDIDSSGSDLAALTAACASTWVIDRKTSEILEINDGVHLETDEEHRDRGRGKHKQSDSCVYVQTLIDLTAEEQDKREREYWDPVR